MSALDFFYNLGSKVGLTKPAKDNRTYGEVVRDATARFSIQSPPGKARGLLPWLRQAVGGWLGPEESHERRQEYYVTSEKLAGGPRGVKLPAFLPFIDEITGETAEQRVWYRRMLRDPIIKAALLGKSLDVASLDLHVNPFEGGNSKDREAARFVGWNLNQRIKGRVPQLALDLTLPGLIDGYSLCEKVWTYHDQGRYQGKYVLDKLKAKDTGNDAVLVLDEFRNITGVLGLRYNAGYVFSPSDFAIFRYLPIFEYPGGMSDLRAAYADYWMYDTVRKLRAICLEKRAMPVLMGVYKDLAQRPALEQVLSRIRWDNWIAAPEWAKVTALEFAGQAVDLYNKTIDDLKQNLFIGIQGAFLQALEGKTSNVRGDSSVQKTTSELFNWYLMVCFLSVLNEQIVPDMCDLNYAGLSGYPDAVMGGINEGELGKTLAVDSGLLQMGIPLSRKAMYRKYGREAPIDESDTLRIPGAAGSATGNPSESGAGSSLSPLPGPPDPDKTSLPALAEPGEAFDGKGEGMDTVAVDFDGTLAEYEGWKGPEDIGDPRADPKSGIGAEMLMHSLKKLGYRLVVFTAREQLDVIEQWLQQHDIPYDQVTNQKPLAAFYIDDRAINTSKSWTKILDYAKKLKTGGAKPGEAITVPAPNKEQFMAKLAERVKHYLGELETSHA